MSNTVRIYKVHPSSGSLAREGLPIIISGEKVGISIRILASLTSLSLYVRLVRGEQIWKAAGTFIPCDETNKILYDEYLFSIVSPEESYLRRLTPSGVEETEDILQKERVTREIITYKENGSLERRIAGEMQGDPERLVVMGCYGIHVNTWQKALGRFKEARGRWSNAEKVLRDKMEDKFFDAYNESDRSRLKSLVQEKESKLLET